MENVTAVIIIIKAEDVDQAHGAVDGLYKWIQTQEHQRQKKKNPAGSDSRRGERRESIKLWEREGGQLVTSIFEIFMHTRREEGMERGA